MHRPTASNIRAWAADARATGRTPNVAYFAARNRRRGLLGPSPMLAAFGYPVSQSQRKRLNRMDEWLRHQHHKMTARYTSASQSLAYLLSVSMPPIVGERTDQGMQYTFTTQDRTDDHGAA